MIDSYISLDGIRAATVIVLALGQALMGYWPQWRRWPETVATRSQRQQLPIVPIPWAFAIWGLIFAGGFAFAVWHALPQNLGDPTLRLLGWFAGGAFLMNVLWQFYVPIRDIDWVSFAIIATAFISLMAVMVLIERADPTGPAAFWLTTAPLQLLAGWITVALFVNLGSTLKWSGIEMTTARQLPLLLGAGVLGSAVAWWSGAFLYALAIAWGLFGIVVSNIVRDRNAAVGVIAALLIPVVIVAAWVGNN